MRGYLRLTGVFLAGFGWQCTYVAAQNTSAGLIFPDCDPSAGLQWAFNKENQSPCELAAVLQGACYGNSWDIPALSSGKQYSGPLLGQSNVCQCSTVAFSLVAACGACQEGAIASWDFWRTNCTASQVTMAAYPLQIPSNISVPAWAYLNVTAGVWDENAAHSFAGSGAPETTGGSPPPATMTSVSLSSIVSTATSSTTGSTPTAISATHSSSKAGPIAGGVVGGVVGLLALALVAFILYRKSYRPKHTTQHGNEKVDIAEVASPTSTSGPGFYTHSRSPSDDPPKLYDPSDPSTFPPSPSQLQYLPMYSPQSPVGSFGPHSHTQFAKPAGYIGAPEV